MNPQTIRLIAAGAIVWYALGMPGVSSPTAPVAPYTGSQTAVHSVSRSMDAKDREGLSAALTAIGAMLKDDRMDAVKTAEDVQKIIQVGLNFGYSTFQVKSYPQVAQAVQDEIAKVVGAESGSIDSGKKSKIGDAVAELGRAVR